MSKFKVGDKVKVINDTCLHGRRVGEVIEIEGMGYRAAMPSNRPAWGIVGSPCYISERDIEPIKNRHSIHITCTDGKTTNAVKKVNGKIVARSKAVCCPADEFDFNVGAQLAFNRLVYGTGYHPSEVALKPEQPKQEDKPKFKVGDRVKIVRANLTHKEKKVGDVCEIKSIYPNGAAMWEKPNYGVGNSYVWFEDELEPYTEHESTEPKLIVTKKMLEEMGACSVGVAAFMENFPSGEGELDAVVAKARKIGRDGDVRWLENRKLMVEEKQNEPKQEPVKLYCVEDYSGFTTKGKIYEFTGGDIRLDDGHHRSGLFTDYADFVSHNKDIALCLIPLVSREAKVGEYVMITSDLVNGTQKNEICEVVSINEYGNNMPYLRTKNATTYGTPEIEPCTLAKHDQYLVLDGYKPEPEKAEPEYLNMRVVCVAGSDGFTVGKVYEFKNGVVVDDDGDVRPSNGNQKITSLSDTYLRDWENKFIEFKGE